ARDTMMSGRDSIVACYSLDTALQNFANKLLRQYRPRYGAGVVMDPSSGRVLALIEYRQEGLPSIGNRLFLRSIFPAASVYKTITASTVIDKSNWTSQTMVPVTGRSSTLYKFQLKRDIEPWKEIPLEEAFAESNNPVFARLGMHFAGRRSLEEYSARFGFNTAIPFELATDSSHVSVPDDSTYAMAELASGFNRETMISPLHGALIASAMVMGGSMPCPHLVDSVVRIDGRVLYKSEPSTWRTPVSPATAAEMRAMMQRVVMKGTAKKSFCALNRSAWSRELDYGGKTGSIGEDSLGKIDWFIGFAGGRGTNEPKLAVGIVTVHGDCWTVHSSYIGAEIFRKYLRPVPAAPIVGLPISARPKG
nr:penicillin-binding transpeptidase domain-containing protein [Chitinispirillaceae bacterium]